MINFSHSIEERHTFRQNSKIRFFDRGQNNCNRIIKREKSADHLKKKPSLKQKVQNFFNEIAYYDTNYNNQNIKNTGKKNNKLINGKNYNTLILFKKNKGDTSVEKKRKSYISPDKFENQKKNNFFKNFLNIRTVSGSKINSNINTIYYYLITKKI